jgi:hypothetical protein
LTEYLNKKLQSEDGKNTDIACISWVNLKGTTINLLTKRGQMLKD